MSSMPTHFHLHLPVSHSDASHPSPIPATHTELRLPHSNPIPPPQFLLSLINDTEARRIIRARIYSLAAL